MIIISQRISWKRNNINKNKPIEVLSHHYAKNKHFFNNKKVISIIYNYLTKKKGKKSTENTKTSISTFTKNIFSRKREKEIVLSSDDQYDCLS